MSSVNILCTENNARKVPGGKQTSMFCRFPAANASQRFDSLCGWVEIFMANYQLGPGVEQSASLVSLREKGEMNHQSFTELLQCRWQ